MEINKNIKKLREKRNETLEEVAKAIGSSKQTIQRYETGEIKNIPYDNVLALSKHFGVRPGYLMGWEIEEETSDEIVNEHIELISLYENLTQEQKDHVLNMMKLFNNN